MAACSQQAPAPPPLPNEILFVRGSAGLQAIEVRDGTVAADLGQRKLAARLSPAGGVAEAYLVDRELAAIEMGRPIQVTRLVELGASVRDAALLPAPGLKNYVGEATVVIVSGADGVDRAFQHGRPLWSRNLGSMRFVGDLALARASDGAWLLVAPETGEPTFASQTCTPGPVAQELGGRPLFDCSSMGSASNWSRLANL